MKVPTAQPHVLPSVGPDTSFHFRTTPDHFGYQVGTALGEIEADLRKRNQLRHKAEAEAEAKSADVAFADDLRSLLDDPEKGYLNQLGQTAYESHNDTAKQIKELRLKHQSALKPGSPSEPLFSRAADRRVENSLNSIAKHASKQLKQWQDDVYGARLETAIDDATVSANDPRLIRQSISTGLAEISDAAQRKGWSPEERDLRGQSFTTSLHTAVIERISGRDLETAQQYYQGNINEIDPTSRAKIEIQFQDIGDRAREKVASDLELSVYSGEASVPEVDAAFEEEVISGAKRTQLIKEIRQRADKAVAGKNRESLITSGLPLDPKNKDHRLAVDEAFTRLGGSSPVALSLTKQTGLLPKQVQSVFRTTARTSTGPKADQVLELYSAVDDQIPLALDDLSDKDVAVLDTASELVRGGMVSQEALEISRTQANLPESERKVIKARYKEDASKDTTWLQDTLNSDDHYDTEIFSGAPTPPASMTADYERLAESFYIHTGGDIDRARELAWKSLKRTWTRSDINGEGELMRYSPEFDLGVSTKVLRKDLDTQLEEIKVKPESVQIVSDVITARSKRGQRSYAVIKVRPDGLPEILRGPNNMPLRWVPEPHTILEKQHQEGLKRAGQKRKQHMKMERVRQHFPDGG
ncbi:MAG: hypothetical protein LC541_04525 [Candidatus Thiodiazotropha sp.]|nr:hypothetical protein [Candidatus Thiodiazotropha sp.]MCM8882582.1 hypothetical protein [Candidatus Thiodiazotropha sp.]MCM8918773.1 hypothetical protein [Candidatus Thiodiazotropha sp.]